MADRAELIPRGMRREPAARYVGVSPTKFDDWVRRRLMPQGYRIDGVVLWDRLELDECFDALKDTVGSRNELDDAA
jgi:hypothetical protein